MRLRQALDRAKKERNDQTPSGEHSAPIKEKDVAVSYNEENPLGPVYSKSRHIDLDPDFLRNNHCVSYFPDSPEGDLYKTIRIQIMQKMQEDGWKTLLISSALPGEGKTMTTLNLAVAFAKELHQTVLLVDADLRRQNVHKYLGYESKTGLADYLAHDVPLSDLIVWPGIAKLSIISGGDAIKDSTEIVSSQKMRSMIVEMKNRYKNRYILFDSPPVLTCPDAIAFAPFIDAIVMVVEADKTTAEEVKKAQKLLPKEKFLGFILNKKKGGGAKRYAAYY